MVDHDFPLEMQFCVSTLSTHLAKANPAGDPSGCACRPDTLGQGSAPVLIVPTRQGWKGPVVMFPEGARTNGSAILVPRGRRIFSWCRDWNLSRGNCDGEGGVFFFKLKAVVEEVFFSSFFLSLFAWVEVLFLFSLS